MKDYTSFEEWYKDFQKGTGLLSYVYKGYSRRQLIRWLGAHDSELVAFLISGDEKKNDPAVSDKTAVLKSILAYGFELGSAISANGAAQQFMSDIDSAVVKLAVVFRDDPAALSFLDGLGIAPFMRGLGKYTGNFAGALAGNSAGPAQFARMLTSEAEYGRGWEKINYAKLEAFCLATDLEAFMRGLGSTAEMFAHGLGVWAHVFGSCLGSRAGLLAKGLGPNVYHFMRGLDDQAPLFIQGLARAKKVEMKDKEALRVSAEALGPNIEFFAEAIAPLMETHVFLDIYTKPFIEGMGKHIEHFARGLEQHAFNFAQSMHMGFNMEAAFAQLLGKNAALFAKGLGKNLPRFMAGLGPDREQAFLNALPPAVAKLFAVKTIDLKLEPTKIDTLRCAYCHDSLSHDETLLECDRCGSLQHNDCGLYLKRCAALNCKGELVETTIDLKVAKIKSSRKRSSS